MRYLFVPAPTGFASDFLAQPRLRGECLCLGADIRFRSWDSWADIRARFPAGWQPDVILIWMADPHVPDGIWTAPVPIIGLAANWFARGHFYRHLMPLCDGIFASPPAVAALANQGYTAVAIADFSGLGESAFRNPLAEDQNRDCDVLILDSLTLPEPTHRNRYAGRIAELSELIRVVIRRPTTWEEDRAWLSQAKVVLVLPTAMGDDRLSYEAIAAGALPVRPQYPWDGQDWLRPGVDYLPYQELNLEEVVIQALQSEPDRQAMVRMARTRLTEWQFANRLGRSLAGLQPQFPELEKRAIERAAGQPTPGLGGRLWAALAGGPPVELPEAGGPSEPPEITVFRGVLAPDPTTAVAHFRQAVTVEPDHPVAHANLAEALTIAGLAPEAMAVAKEALARLERTAIRPLIGWDVPLFPPIGEAFDLWEAAAWSATPTLEAQSKRLILRWKLHLLLAELTGQLSHFYEAALARPDWPAGQAALGCAISRQGRFTDALAHLAKAVDADPFDRAAARAFMAALQESGDDIGARMFARRNRRLANVDPVGCPSEDWFAAANPVGDELVSIIVVDTQAEPPRACLEALLRTSRPPCEIIIVGSGDTDWLKDTRGRPGSQQVAALRVAVGMPWVEMVNRGLTTARGDFVAVLDSQTMVGKHWLDRLIEPLCNFWPRVAAVGPTIPNGTFDSQRQPGTAPRLDISCFVTHQAMLEGIGPLDPALGGFASDDWATRARHAGFQLMVARDVSVSAVEMPTTPTQLEVFTGRWGQLEAAAYIPGEKGWNRRPTISACLIVRDEEVYLPDCLESIAGLVDEIIVVDTGSTDRTREVALSFGARVFEFPWIDDFSAARNESLRRATGDWIFWLDADDRLAEPDRAAFRQLSATLSFAPAAHVFSCYCPHGPEAATVVDHVRLFRNDPRLNWTYRVHEQILPSIRACKMPVIWSAVRVTHVGYAATGARDKKLERDMRLLQIEAREQPNDPFTRFNLGCLLLEAGKPAEALDSLNQSLLSSDPADSIVRKLYAQIARCHKHLGHPEALEKTLAEGRKVYPDDAELLTLAAERYESCSDWAEAAACWRKLLEGQDGQHFASVPADLRGNSARRGLERAERHLSQPKDQG
ncbi:MAG: glycosyltransferase [Fimbriiglobus sp.]